MPRSIAINRCDVEESSWTILNKPSVIFASLPKSDELVFILTMNYLLEVACRIFRQPDPARRSQNERYTVHHLNVKSLNRIKYFGYYYKQCDYPWIFDIKGHCRLSDDQRVILKVENGSFRIALLVLLWPGIENL